MADNVKDLAAQIIESLKKRAGDAYNKLVEEDKVLLLKIATDSANLTLSAASSADTGENRAYFAGEKRHIDAQFKNMISGDMAVVQNLFWASVGDVLRFVISIVTVAL